MIAALGILSDTRGGGGRDAAVTLRTTAADKEPVYGGLCE